MSSKWGQVHVVTCHDLIFVFSPKSDPWPLRRNPKRARSPRDFDASNFRVQRGSIWPYLGDLLMNLFDPRHLHTGATNGRDRWTRRRARRRALLSLCSSAFVLSASFAHTTLCNVRFSRNPERCVFRWKRTQTPPREVTSVRESGGSYLPSFQLLFNFVRGVESPGVSNARDWIGFRNDVKRFSSSWKRLGRGEVWKSSRSAVEIRVKRDLHKFAFGTHVKPLTISQELARSSSLN